MIYGIRGKVFSKKYDSIQIESYGVVYQIFIPLRIFSELPDKGEEVFLYTARVLGENEDSLYGFLREHERELFIKIINVMGVGPKTALNLFSKMTYEEIVKTIEEGDEKALTSIPGIGKKSAGRIILELSGKIIKPTQPQESTNEEIISALTNLGYKRKQAEDAVKKALKTIPPDNIEEILRESLKILYEAQNDKRKQ